MKIVIKEELTRILPKFNVIAYTLDVQVTSSDVIEPYLLELERQIKDQYTLEEVLTIPLIKEARDGYKRLGKDPSRYRLAVESLYRRLVKGNDLYRINNVVDVGNALSIITKRSVCVADAEKIDGDIIIRIGQESDIYEGINRGVLNVTNIPIYEDKIGPFGSTTSDTHRTAITQETKQALVMIICFSDTELEEHASQLQKLFQIYAYSKNIKQIPVFRK